MMLIAKMSRIKPWLMPCLFLLMLGLTLRGVYYQDTGLGRVIAGLEGAAIVFIGEP